MRSVITTHDTVVDEPVAPALTTAYAKSFFRSTNNAEDTLVGDWVLAGTSHFEEQTGRQVITARRQYTLDAVPCQRRVQLPRPPLQVVESVEYLDANGNWVSFSDGGSPETVYWQFTAPTGSHAERGWVEPIVGMNWPVADGLRVTFTCGYGDTDAAVPALVKTAIGGLVAHFNRFRSPVSEVETYEVPLTVSKMIEAFKWSAVQTIVPRRFW